MDIPGINTTAVCLGWQDIIDVSNSSQGMILPEAVYEFRVVGCDHKQYEGGTKIPPCNMAALTLQVSTEDGIVYVNDNFYLVTWMTWKIAAFYQAIGLADSHCDQIRMDWDHMIGRTGLAHIHPVRYLDQNGIEHHKNEVQAYISPDDLIADDSFPDLLDELPLN